MRLAFAGTPGFAATSLCAVLDAGHEVVAVYTQPDRRAGRGRRPVVGEVKRLAIERGVEVCQPATLRDTRVVEGLRILAPDAMVVAAYGLILPREVLAVPPLGCINVHASLLPRWRGAAPIQHAILAGDAETGVSIMAMDEGLDTGAVLGTSRSAIEAADTAASLGSRLADLGARALLEVLAALPSGALVPQPQDEAAASYAPRIDKRDGAVDWRRPAIEIARLVRAFDPWPVAWTTLGDPEGTRLRLWSASASTTQPGASPGTIMALGRAGIDVATGDGTVRLLEVQPANSRRMSAAAFVHSERVRLGSRLGVSPA